MYLRKLCGIADRQGICGYKRHTTEISEDIPAIKRVEAAYIRKFQPKYNCK